MVNNNKILTVSYGTFSCTLEGFDDSFGTMKAIAEYFRDLASDDRYFGAEPPQPDAEMLARIAQKEISRRVEAHEEDGNFVLRAGAEAAAIAAPVAAAATPAPQEPAPEADTKATPEAKAEPVEAISGDVFADESYDDADEAVAPMTSFMPEPEASAAPVVSGDSIAAKLQRIRAVVSRGDEPVVQPDYSEDEHAENLLSETAQDLEAALAADDAAMEEDEAPVDIEGDDVSSLLHRLTTRDDAEEDAAEDEAIAQDEVEEVADLADDDVEEDDVADAMEAVAEVEDEMPEDDFDASVAEIAQALAVDQTDAEETPEVAQDDAIIELDDVEDIKAAIQGQTAQDDAVEDEVSLELDDEDETDLEVAGENLFDAGDGSFDGSDDTLDLSGYDLPAEDSDEAARDEEMYEDEVQAEEDTVPSPLRARVLKVKRADLDAALADGSIEEETDDASASSLSEEEEAELLRDLAEAEAIASDADDVVTAEDDDYMLSDLDRAQETAEEDLDEDEDEDEEPEAASLLRSNLHLPEEEDDGDDLTRLMEEAKHQMEEPEGSGRRDAFAHLRAAVAATKAEETLGSDHSDDDAEEVYREDLANVVRPRRPSAGTGRTQRPGEGRPAPLKLVAEQRIDMANSSGPVRPRRVAASAAEAAETEMEEADSFAEYARNLGATKLPDMLEAAASYMSFVEGREQFSRPQLMNKIRQIEKEDFSREDGLRSFGQLLRAGKIEKLKGGRFTVSDRIAFKPDEREAG